jgi:hypothetical protein
MKEVGFKEYHDDLGVNKYLVQNGVSNILVLPHFNSLLVVVTITTQNKDFNKDHIEVYRASIDELLQFHQLK